MATRRTRTEPKPSARPLQIYVRRGALWRLHRLKRDTQHLPVDVSWDRRQSDRRSALADPGQEPPAMERRKALPSTWHTADFVVVEPPEDE